MIWNTFKPRSIQLGYSGSLRFPILTWFFLLLFSYFTPTNRTGFGHRCTEVKLLKLGLKMTLTDKYIYTWRLYPQGGNAQTLISKWRYLLYKVNASQRLLYFILTLYRHRFCGLNRHISYEKYTMNEDIDWSISSHTAVVRLTEYDHKHYTYNYHKMLKYGISAYPQDTRTLWTQWTQLQLNLSTVHFWSLDSLFQHIVVL